MALMKTTKLSFDRFKNDGKVKGGEYLAKQTHEDDGWLCDVSHEVCWGERREERGGK